MKKNKNSNLIALAIGLFLIILIALVTIFRPSTLKKSDLTTVNPQNAIIEKLKNASKISSSDLAKKISGGEDMTLVDIRSEEMFASEHLLNSINVPLAKINDEMGALNKEKAYVIVDSGSTLGSVASTVGTLSDAGFKNILYLDGGLDAWKLNYNPTISGGDPNSFTDQSKVSYIQTDKLRELLKTEKNLAIIDVRKSGQFNEGHIKDAVNIFLDDLEKRKNDIPLGKKIILYDNDGLWAFKAATRLFDMGFFNTLALSDGLNSWKQKNYEIVK